MLDPKVVKLSLLGVGGLVAIMGFSSVGSMFVEESDAKNIIKFFKKKTVSFMAEMNF